MYYKKTSSIDFIGTLSENKKAEHHLFQHYLYYHKFSFLVLFLIVTSAIFILDRLNQTSESELQISMSDYIVPNLPGGSEDEGTSKLLKSSMTTARIQQLIYSKEMTDRLISKFQLYTHYDINPNSEFSYSVIKRILKKKITYRFQAGEIISICVQDKDPHFAAAVANEIGEKMGLMNKRMIVESLQKKVKLNEMILTEMSAMYNKTNLELNNCLAQLKRISKTNRLENNLQWESTVSSFQSIANNFSSKWDNFTNSDKMFKLINISTTEMFIPEIRIIQPATPSYPSSEIPYWLKIAGYIILSLSFTMALAYIRFSWTRYFRLNPLNQ